MKKSILIIVFSMLLYGVLAYREEQQSNIGETGSLKRESALIGDYEEELLLKIEEQEEQDFLVQVPARRFTKEEETKLLEAALQEAEALFLGENESLDCIRVGVEIRDTYQEGLVSAEWEFSDPWLMDVSGKVREEELLEEGQQVEARLTLQCEDSAIMHVFGFSVYKAIKTQEEKQKEAITDWILQEGKAEGTEELKLPKEIDGVSLSWRMKKTGTSLQVLLLGIIAALLMPLYDLQKEKERQKQREQELLREYPEMVMKLSLLLGAGMNLFHAWEKITEMYLKARKEGHRNKMAVYEEMLITRREIESGKGEGTAYAAFGERCGIQKYRKLSNYLVQNLRKGTSGMQAVLEQEASEVFEERKALAKRYSEEAGTKLLFPMLLMLGIVIFIIFVPAVLSFQTAV